VQCFDPAREIRLLSFTSVSRAAGSSSHETMCSNVGDLEIPISCRARTFGDAWISFLPLLLFARSLAVRIIIHTCVYIFTNRGGEKETFLADGARRAGTFVSDKRILITQAPSHTHGSENKECTRARVLKKAHTANIVTPAFNALRH
jgi:hypothetical protein